MGAEQPPTTTPAHSSTAPAGVSRHEGRREVAARLAGVGGASLLAVGSILAWLGDPDAVFGLQGVLWLLGIALFLASCVGWRGAGGDVTREANQPWSRHEALAFAALVALSLFTHLAWLYEIPWRFHYDEVIARNEALRFFSGEPVSLFTTTWWGTTMPSLPFAYSGLLMHFVGTGLDGVRFGVALIGALTLIPIYGVARLLAGPRAALLAGLAAATTAAMVHYARVSIVNSTTAFFWAVCFYFLLRGLRWGAPSDFAWAGLVAGLSMYTYYGTRLLPYLLLAFFLYLLIAHFRAIRAMLGHCWLLLAGFLVGFGPFLAYFIRYPDMWAARGLSQLNVPPAFPVTVDELVADWNRLAPLLWENFLGLGLVASRDGTYWSPLLLIPQAVLLLLGLGIALWRWRQPGYFLLLLWSLSVVFVGGTLVDAAHAPAFARWAPAFPAFTILLSLPAAVWLRSLAGSTRKRQAVAWVAVVAGAVAIAGANAYHYLVVYPGTVPPAFESAQGRYLARLHAGERVRFVGNSWQPFYSEVAAMMAPHLRGSDLLNPGRSLPLPGGGDDLTFLFNDDQLEYLPVVQHYYPGGEGGRIETPGGPIGQTYRVLAAEVERQHGVLLAVTDADTKRIWEGKVTKVGALPETLTSTGWLTATWSGAFFLTGTQTLRLRAGSAAEMADLWVQGVLVHPSTIGAPLSLDSRLEPLLLDGGWVPFAVQARLASGCPTCPTPQLRRQRGDGGWSEVDTSYLWPQPPGRGLALTMDGNPAMNRIDQFIGASMLGKDPSSEAAEILQELRVRDPDLLPLAPLQGSARRFRWEGEVYAEGGNYRMEIRTDAHALLHIDGATVLNVCSNQPHPGEVPLPSGDPWAGSDVTLEAGWHTVRLEMEATGRNNGLEWAWVRPDRVREIVPPSRLRYSPGTSSDEKVRWPVIPSVPMCP